MNQESCPAESLVNNYRYLLEVDEIEFFFRVNILNIRKHSNTMFILYGFALILKISTVSEAFVVHKREAAKTDKNELKGEFCVAV